MLYPEKGEMGASCGRAVKVGLAGGGTGMGSGEDAVLVGVTTVGGKYSLPKWLVISTLMVMGD
jgi:hypothetical protein